MQRAASDERAVLVGIPVFISGEVFGGRKSKEHVQLTIPCLGQNKLEHLLTIW